MRPLILIYFSIGIVYGNPESPIDSTSTPSAAPAILANLPTPTPSIAPSLLTENVPYSGQFGLPPVVRINGKPQGLVLRQPQFGLPFDDFGFNYAQPGFNFAQAGFNFAQPDFNFGQSGFNFIQPGLNFGEHYFNIGGPQLTFGAGPSIGFNTVPFSVPPVKPTPNVIPTRPTPDITTKPAQLNVSPTQVNVSPTQLKLPPVKTTASPPRIEYLTKEKNVGSSSGDAIVHKHIYFHVAPPEPEIEQSPRVIVPPPRKHVRLIFIKAPPPPKPVIALPPPNDERTIVYVLARKPEAQPEIRIETTTPISPPKPEVYFIRYNAQKQSAANVDTSADTELPEEAHGDQHAVTENPIFNIDTRFNADEVDVNEGDKAVTLNLNEASLTGGSALSQAVTGATDDNAFLVSSTPVPDNK